MSSESGALQLKEVPGPSALGGGRRRFFDLLWLIAVNKFKVIYVGAALGYVWTLIRPLMLFAVLLFVFTQIFKISGGVTHYPVLLLFGVMLFSFFQEATTKAVTSFVAEEGIVRKMQFPRLAIPMAWVLTSLFTLAVNMIVVFVFILAYGIGPYWTWLLLPALFLPLLVLTTAVSALLSALYVRYRDVNIIWSVAVQTLFYATPVLYVLDQLDQQYRWIILLNPLTPIFLAAREWIIDPSAPGPVDSAGGVTHLVGSLVVFVAVCVVSIWVFAREAPKMAEEL